jgi:hypothetical protein
VIGLVLAAAVAATPAGVDALGWIAGSWIERRGETVVREVWLAPMGGVMAGVSQTNRPGRKPLVDAMRISVEPAGVTFTATVPGQPPTAFLLKPGPPGEAVFENLGHDFPQRVIYRRCGQDLCARIEGTVGEQVRSQDWRYERMNDNPN